MRLVVLRIRDLRQGQHVFQRKSQGTCASLVFNYLRNYLGAELCDRCCHGKLQGTLRISRP
jgi:hypothetical protein